MNKYIIAFLGCLVFVIGGVLGYTSVGERVTPILKNTAAIRVSDKKSDVDYDFQVAIEFLKDNLEKKGIKVLGTAYVDELYPKNLDKAEINVFARAFKSFYNVRTAENRKSVFYIHRSPRFFFEEMKTHDFLLSSQKDIIKNGKTADYMIDYLPVGYVKHPKLETTSYLYDVLCIYEVYTPAYEQSLQNFYKMKVLSGVDFALLDKNQREQLLAQSKMIVYIMDTHDFADADYVPYAVYDIVSYGRPLLTNHRQYLVDHFAPYIWTFNNDSELVNKTIEILKNQNRLRENAGTMARQKLFEQEEMAIPFMDKLIDTSNHTKKAK